MKIGLKEVAEKTGYSITTVSRALAGYSDVNAQTRQHIVETAQSLGYEPNLVARQLRNQKTQTIGVIVPTNDRSFPNDFFGQLILGVSSAAAREHYDLLISAQIQGEEEMAAYQRIVGGNRVDGMILARTRQHDPRISYLQKKRHPFVVSGRSAPNEPSNYPYIDVDSQAGVHMLVRHFAELGHQRIGLILPPEELAFTEFRLHGYQDGLKEAGLPYQPENVVYGDLLPSGGFRGTQQLLSSHQTVSAIIACNDLMALGAMNAIQAAGLRVGEDVAVAGFDDIPAAEFSHPSLTTIRQPIYDIGQQLVSLLMDVINGKPVEETQVILPCTLVVRESSGSL